MLRTLLRGRRRNTVAMTELQSPAYESPRMVALWFTFGAVRLTKADALRTRPMESYRVSRKFGLLTCRTEALAC